MLECATAQGKTVAHIGVFSGDDTTASATGINVLAWIDIDDPEAEVHVRTVVSWIFEKRDHASRRPDGKIRSSRPWDAN